jgi:hypothetical protein
MASTLSQRHARAIGLASAVRQLLWGMSIMPHDGAFFTHWGYLSDHYSTILKDVSLKVIVKKFFISFFRLLP